MPATDRFRPSRAAADRLRRARPWLLILLTACAGDPGSAPPASHATAADSGPTDFVDVAPKAGLTRVHIGGGPDKAYIVEAKGGGSTVIDADGDGDLDIYWVNGATLADVDAGAGNALYRNDGGLSFTDVAVEAGVSGSGWGMGAIAGDIDNDGSSDLYVTCFRDNLLYRGEGSGHFVEVGQGTDAVIPVWSTGAAFGDYDLDGDLDLYVSDYVDFAPGQVAPLGTLWKGVPAFIGPLGLPAEPDHLLRNDGDHFTDVSVASGVSAVEPGYGLGVLFVDIDADGHPDIYVANDSSPNFLLRNDGHGHFTGVALAAQASHGAMGNAQAGMGVAAGDYDGDGYLDLFVTNFDDDYNTLYHNVSDDGPLAFEDVSFAVGLAEPALPFVGFGANFLDVDNDADLDLFVANGHVYPQIDTSGTNSSYAQDDHLFLNDGGRFRLYRPGDRSPFGPPRVSRTSIAADFDDDGDLDIFVAHLNDAPSLYRNDLTAGHWLGLRLRGRTSNRDGVGVRVEVSSGARTQLRIALRGSSFLSSEDPRIHVGLGGVARVDSVVIRWPSGAVQRLLDVAADRYLDVSEP